MKGCAWRRAVVFVPLLALAALLAAACSCEDDEPDMYSQLMHNASVATAAAARTVQAGTAVAPPSPPSTTGSPTPTDIPGLNYATISPIKAVFNEDARMTTYTLVMRGPFPNGASVRWSGPNCGTVEGTVWEISGTSVQGPPRDAKSEYKWTHPHPPCGDTPNHADVTVVATITEDRVTTICTFRGAATDTGPACFRK
jgi:hypothetical protein